MIAGRRNAALPSVCRASLAPSHTRKLATGLISGNLSCTAFTAAEESCGVDPSPELFTNLTPVHLREIEGRPLTCGIIQQRLLFFLEQPMNRWRNWESGPR